MQLGTSYKDSMIILVTSGTKINISLNLLFWSLLLLSLQFSIVIVFVFVVVAVEAAWPKWSGRRTYNPGPRGSSPALT